LQNRAQPFIDEALEAGWKRARVFCQEPFQSGFMWVPLRLGRPISDQMVWPDALSAGIDSIQNAPMLTYAQKRDILYNNAARFLRLQR
jgi:hypothetical protein